jgi:hypothetical protein
MDIHFEGQYDKELFQQALGLVQRQSLLSRILRLTAIFLASIVIGIAVYNWIASGIFEFAKFARSIIAVALLGYYYVSPYISQRVTINNLFSDVTLRTMRGHANTQGVFLSSPNSQPDVSFEWKVFFRVGKKNGLLSLYTSDGTVALFHRNFFADESDWHQFEQLVDQKVKEPK